MTIKFIKIAWYFAWTETIARYRRSILGPFWLIIGTGISIVGLGVIWSKLLHVSTEQFVPSITIGLVLWQFISTLTAEAPSNFMRNAQTLISINLPPFFFTLQSLFKSIINFLHALIVVTIVFLYYSDILSPIYSVAGIGVLLLIINLFWIAHLLGFLGARYRDLDPLITALLPIIFFLSPVIYEAKQLPGAEILMALNPVAYFIEIIREPMLGSLV